MILRRFGDEKSMDFSHDGDREKCACWVCLMFVLVKKSDEAIHRMACAEYLLRSLDSNKLEEQRGGYTVLSHACKSGLVEVAGAVIEKAPKLLDAGNPHPLWIAASEGHVGVLRTLLQNKESVSKEEAAAPDGTTPLMMVILKENPEAFSVLRKIYGNDEILEEVVKFGSVKLLHQIECRDNLSHDLITAAIQSGNAEMVEEILLKVTDIPGETFETSPSLGVLRAFGKEEHQLESDLTQFSKAFPFFNEDVEGPKQHGEVRHSLPLSQLDEAILTPFCCTTKDLSRLESLVSKCEEKCTQ